MIKLLNCLPLILASAHASLSFLIFGLAISDPGKRGLWPLVMFFIDYPCSILMESLRRAFHTALFSDLLVDGLVYGIIGSAWFFGIGLLVRRGVMTFARR